MTELVTGLGMTGLEELADALDVAPTSMVSVSPEQWRLLRELHRGGALRAEFAAAFANGRAFFEASEGLRGRVPLTIEWKGATRAPGDEVVPADLRIDHVYLVSCKYLSKIVLNASPAYLFERLLAGGHGVRGTDWFALVAPTELATLYDAATARLGLDLPPDLRDLRSGHRAELTRALKGRWPDEVRGQATAFAEVVALRTAEIWGRSLSMAQAKEQFLWRLLRVGSAPYFVLGTDKDRSLRLRVQTPWDWRQQFTLRDLRVAPRRSQQPTVDWTAEVEERASGRMRSVEGHVEVRWSHGKFCGAPEAKVYLDTPHHLVPGYVPLA